MISTIKKITIKKLRQFRDRDQSFLKILSNIAKHFLYLCLISVKYLYTSFTYHKTLKFLNNSIYYYTISWQKMILYIAKTMKNEYIQPGLMVTVGKKTEGKRKVDTWRETGRSRVSVARIVTRNAHACMNLRQDIMTRQRVTIRSGK